jgi:UDP-N-acetylglucosamine 2-epimerase
MPIKPGLQAKFLVRETDDRETLSPYPGLTLRRSPPLVVFWLQRYFANVFGGSRADVGSSGLYCVDLLIYLDFLFLIAHANLVSTDSGGIQEEATILVVPCVTIRENTDRPIKITQGTNVLAEVSTQLIIAHAKQKVNTIQKNL